jgi:hypothetical protein
MRLILFLFDATLLIAAGTIIYTAYIAGKNSRKEKKELK